MVSNMNHKEILELIGLSNSESTVYMALLKLGRTRAGKIIKITGLQSSVVHNALNTLLEKGFISYIHVGSVKEYAALDPSVIESYINHKKATLHSILPELKSMQQVQNFTTAEIYEGYEGILAAMLSLCAEAKKGEVYKYFASASQYISPESLAFFTRADRARKQAGLIIRGIATYDTKELGDYSESEIRFTHENIPPTMNIFRDKIILMSVGSKPTAVMIHSKELADQYHILWDKLWKESKPLKK